MRVKHTAYPNHIGHLETNGCFRCHSNLHKSKEGRTISKDCEMCHSIVAQGRPGELMTVSIYDTLEFKHPEDIGEMWKEVNCAECHTALY